MCVSEGISVYSTCYVRNGNFLKMRVSEIRAKRIPVNLGLGVHIFVVSNVIVVFHLSIIISYGFV